MLTEVCEKSIAGSERNWAQKIFLIHFWVFWHHGFRTKIFVNLQLVGEHKFLNTKINIKLNARADFIEPTGLRGRLIR